MLFPHVEKLGDMSKTNRCLRKHVLLVNCFSLSTVYEIGHRCFIYDKIIIVSLQTKGNENAVLSENTEKEYT